MLKKKILKFEDALFLYYLLQALIPDKFTFNSQLLGFITLLILKYFFESYRLASLLLLPVQLILLVPKPIILDLLLVSGCLLILKYFPVYEYPMTTGPYKVGYKTLIFSGITYVGVYYPTNEITEDVSYSPSHNSWERFVDLILLYADYQKKRMLPKFVFKIAMSFLQYLRIGVNKDARIIKPEATNKTFPVVVFSHGHSANIHIYSYFLKEWASNGFIVFSVDHEESIFFNTSKFKDVKEYFAIRKTQLNERQKTVHKVLDYISNEDNIHELFSTEDVKLDYNRLFASDHSSGAATVAEVAVTDERVTAGLVLLDPWYNVSNLETLFTPINKPILSLRSETFDKQDEEREHALRYADVNRKGGMILSGVFKGSAHNTTSDMPLVMSREMTLFGMMSNMKGVGEQVINHTVMTMNFLKTVLANEGKVVKEKIPNTVLERFKEDLSKSGIKDLFIVDM